MRPVSILVLADTFLESGDASINYLSPLLAIVVGIVHASLAPVIEIGGVKPNLVLVAVVLVTCLAGFVPGITWAFVGGLTANLLVGDPLGSMPLAMLVAAAVVAGGVQALGRMVWVYPVVAAFGASMVADLVALFVVRLVSDTPPAGVPFQIIFAAALLNMAIVALLLVPARLLALRLAPDEAAAW